MGHFLRYMFFCLVLCISLIGDLQYESKNSPQETTSAQLLFDSKTSDDTIKVLPLPTSSAASAFLHVKQLYPDYALLVEFLPENWSVGLYRKLIDSGKKTPWYINTSSSSNKQRLSGWKDSNLQYKKGLIQPA